MSGWTIYWITRMDDFKDAVPTVYSIRKKDGSIKRFREFELNKNGGE